MLDSCLRLPDSKSWVPALVELQQSETAGSRHLIHISYVLNRVLGSEAPVALLWALPPELLLLLDSVQAFAGMRYCFLGIVADARQSSSLAYADFGATERKLLR